MKLLLALFLLISLSFSAVADSRAVRIERDLNITSNILQELLQKDTTRLLQTLSNEEQVTFEREIFRLKQEAERLSRKFESVDRYPSGSKKQEKKP